MVRSGIYIYEKHCYFSGQENQTQFVLGELKHGVEKLEHLIVRLIIDFGNLKDTFLINQREHH
jgi:hypothetical protein